MPKLCALFVLLSSLAAAQPPADVEKRLADLDKAVKSAQSAGDNAWMLVSAALVLMMTGPGLALFYGGLVRRKNVLGTLMHSFILLAMISVQWVLWGYSIAFGPDIGGVLGSLHYAGLTTVGSEPGPYADTIPHLAFMI